MGCIIYPPCLAWLRIQKRETRGDSKKWKSQKHHANPTPRVFPNNGILVDVSFPGSQVVFDGHRFSTAKLLRDKSPYGRSGRIGRWWRRDLAHGLMGIYIYIYVHTYMYMNDMYKIKHLMIFYGTSWFHILGHTMIWVHPPVIKHGNGQFLIYSSIDFPSYI